MRKIVLAFICGFSAAIVMLSSSAVESERVIVKQIVASVNAENDIEKVRALTGVTHNLLNARAEVFAGTRWHGFRTFRDDLETARGACGSYARVSARLLKEAGFQVKLVQLRCRTGGGWGCHIVTEANKDGKSWTIDALNNVAFPYNARVMSAEFPKLEPNLPASYDRRYDFSEVRYTNWGKVPIFGSALQRLWPDVSLSALLPDINTALACLGLISFVGSGMGLMRKGAQDDTAA